MKIFRCSVCGLCYVAINGETSISKDTQKQICGICCFEALMSGEYDTVGDKASEYLRGKIN